MAASIKLCIYQQKWLVLIIEGIVPLYSAVPILHAIGIKQNCALR